MYSTGTADKACYVSTNYTMKLIYSYSIVLMRTWEYLTLFFERMIEPTIRVKVKLSNNFMNEPSVAIATRSSE